MPLKQTVVDFVALEIGVHIAAMGAVAVDVNADQNFIGQGLKRPPNEGLKHITRHVNLGEVTATLGVRIPVVGGHEVLLSLIHI